MDPAPGTLLKEAETPDSFDRASGPEPTESPPPDGDAPASAEEGGPLANLSPSRASDFKTCPQLFKYRHVDKLPSIPTPAQARGTAVHLALERLFLLPAAERHPERLLELFDVAWEETLDGDEYRELFAGDPESREEFHRSSRAVAERYFQIEDPRDLEPLERELHISLVIDDGKSRQDDDRRLEIRGVIDRLDPAPGGGFVITDYKTGRAPPLRFADSSFFALKVYALMIQENHHRTPDLVRLLYLGNSEVYSLPVSPTQLRGVKKQLQALWWAIDRAISTGTFPTRKTRLCDWCSYQPICPAWADLPSPPDPDN
ncbi:MAG: PD-(D/E)XK nuclease family protein [bacterium]|nr:PD-(D/E)XK nuclease family protein [bacterium]